MREVTSPTVSEATKLEYLLDWVIKHMLSFCCFQFTMGVIYVLLKQLVSRVHLRAWDVCF